MRIISRGWLAALLLSSMLIPVAALAKAPVAAPVTAGGPAVNPLAVAWPQDSSDMKPDPAAHFGRLANGMTYVIYRNATPAGTIAMHLRINAGSLVENDNERGLAHLVEHMAFNGSAHIPKNQLLPLMQRHGLKLGPDAGAYTLPEKTEYIFDMPANDDETLDTALTIAREISGNLSFDAAAIDEERSVVLGEERLRQSPLMASQTAWMATAFPGQAYATRGSPIGLAEVIRTVPRQTLLDYYHAFYRPELTTLIIVGDVDPDAVEARIRARFDDWSAVGPARTVDFGAYRTKGLTTFAQQAPSLPDLLAATWFRPWSGKALSVEDTDSVLMDAMVTSILTQRIQYFAQLPQNGAVGGNAAVQTLGRTARVTQVSVMPRPGQGAAALAMAVRAVRQLTTYGATPQEIEQSLRTFDGVMQAQVAGARTRTNEAIIDNLVSNLDVNSVFTSPQQDLDWYTGFKARLTPERLRAHAAAMFAGDGPLLAHTATDLAGFDGKAMKASYKAAMKARVEAFGSATAKPWPYTDFGPAQAPSAEQASPAFGYKRYVFANGVRLNLMPTTFKDDEIRVSVAFRGGLQSLAPDTSAPVGAASLYAAVGGLMGAGLGQLDRAELLQTLAGKTVNISFNLGDQAATLDGTTTRADLATQLQLMMAFTTDAGWYPDMYNQLQKALPTVYSQLDASPQGIMSVKLPELIHSGDRRFVFPDLAQAQAVPFEAVRDLIKGLISDAPVEITLVGDMDPAEALKQVELTFGNLSITPARAKVAPGGDQLRFPTKDLDQTFYHKGRADQSYSVVAWPLPGALDDVKESRGLEVLTEILNQRVFEQIRQKLGQAYDANATRSQSAAFRGFGVLQVSGSVAAGQDEAFGQAVAAIVSDLQTRPVTADELERARKPLLETWRNDQKDNSHWMAVIPRLAEEPARAAAEQSERDDLMAVTPDTVMALARTWLVADRALRMRILPEPAKP